MFAAINNDGGTPVEVEVTTEQDEYPFVAITIRDGDGDDVFDFLIEDEANIEALIADATEALAEFRKMKA